jgi:hypothetical protein
VRWCDQQFLGMQIVIPFTAYEVQLLNWIINLFRKKIQVDSQINQEGCNSFFRWAMSL